jgi:hypothetical protein
MEKVRNACTFLVGKLEGNRPFGKTRHRWVGYINLAEGAKA